MLKEEKELNSQDSNREELIKSEFGFVYDFLDRKRKAVSQYRD